MVISLLLNNFALLLLYPVTLYLFPLYHIPRYFFPLSVQVSCYYETLTQSFEASSIEYR